MHRTCLPQEGARSVILPHGSQGVLFYIKQYVMRIYLPGNTVLYFHIHRLRLILKIGVLNYTTEIIKFFHSHWYLSHPSLISLNSHDQLPIHSTENLTFWLVLHSVFLLYQYPPTQQLIYMSINLISMERELFLCPRVVSQLIPL